ncbi:MAG: PQQ-dependent sugar dehydrogenase [Ferruginibacter sp.]
MKSIINILLPFFLLFLSGDILAQPANNTCASAITLQVGTACSVTNGSLYQATATNPSGSACGNRQDVWYKFTVPSYTVTIKVNLTASSNLSTTNTYIELFNTNNCTINGTATGGCNNINLARTFNGLIPGNLYYFRINTTVIPDNNATFNVCLTAPPASRMGEVFKQTVLSAAGILNYPWEVTYGPDNNLWITESKGYKVYKIDPGTGARTTVLDISQNSTFLPAPDRVFNCQFNNGSGAQGGLAGLAVHPKFLDPVTPQNYVYISYIYSSDGGSSPNGIFYTNRLVRFTYNTVTGRLGSPVSLCDTLPGSSDHNSQRMIIAPLTTGGTNYLFYAQGDMGAGQFGNRLRPNKAQNPSVYEGKILRFNLLPDGDPGLAAWTPNDNPYTATSAVYSIGIRNNQGFAYDTTTNILYGTSHGPYSDDEINAIESFKNYGHPLVIGFVADGNYNGNFNPGTNTSVSAGAPLTDNGGNSSCPPIGNEATRKTQIDASGNGLYKDPLFSAYAPGNASITNTWQTNPGNANWYSEGWSGLDIYSNTIIPGWKRSLVAAGLKWGRLIRLKLGATGTTTLPSNLAFGNTGDTVTYFQSTNRYRDLAFAPNGKDIFLVMDNSSATSGPGVGNPTVPACPGCVIKYTFLGYADAGGLSSIPKTIDVTDAAVNTCNTGTQVTIDNSNNFLWVPITGPDGNIMAEINAMGQNLGLVTSSFYKNSGSLRISNGTRYLDRNITISPAVTSFATPVKLRLYISKAEYDDLAADPLSGITNINQLKILKNNDPCGPAIGANTTMLNPVNTLAADLAHGVNGYVLQVNVSGFSSFYFAANNITVPLNLLTFTGTLQNNVATLLNWKTANEINSSHFDIERSDDGRQFNQIGTVAGTGNSSTETSYNYTDADVTNLLSQYAFYRLKMVDIGGLYKYSNTIKVTLPEIKGGITISPNPAIGELKAKIISPAAGNAAWQIIDNGGRVIMSNTALLKKGSNELVININSLAAGSYYLKISGTNIDSETKFQKL